MHFWTEEIYPSMADERMVAAAGAKESPATLPALTHLCPVTHTLKIVWLHSVKQGKVHPTEDTLTDFLRSSITHSGVSRLHISVCGET